MKRSDHFRHRRRLPVSARRAVNEPLERRQLLAVSAELVEIPITAAAIAADPALASYRSFDLKVTVTPGDRFNVAGFQARLTSGEFYRAPGGSHTTNPAVWALNPNLEFATFVCVQDFAVPPLGVLPYVGTVGTPILTATEFSPAWGTYGTGTVGATGFTVARLTVRGDAAGDVYGQATGVVNPNAFDFFVASLPVGARQVGLARGRVDFSGPRPAAGYIVFSDANGNGSLDAGEPRATSATSDYNLVLPAGGNSVRVVPPPDHTVTVPPGGAHAVTLAGGQVVGGIDFRVDAIGQASIAGRTLLDDPVFGAATTPMAGVTVFLDHDNNGVVGPLEPSTTTDALGRYSFGQLVAGTYHVRELISFPFAPIANHETVRTITVTQTQQVANFDFRNRRIDVSAVRGFVRATDNAPLSGWTVYLDRNNSGTFDAGDVHRVTDSAGRFEFAVAPGTYPLRQVLQPGFVFHSPADGAFLVNLAGGTAEERVFVNRPVAVTGRIGGNVKRHAAHYVGSALGLSNWTVYLDADNDGTLDANERRTATNAAGDYAFDDLAAGTHVVRVKKPTGWRYMSFSTDTHVVDLPAGQNLTGRDFVYTQRIMIAGVVFNDLNGNGVKNAGEHGVTGRRVWVDLDNDGLISAGEPGGYVGQKGVWGFEDLVAGTYTVRVEEIQGWQNVGSGAYAITLASGKVTVGVPFGQKKIVLPPGARSTVPPPPRYIGELSPEVDLTNVWARM